MTEILCHYTVLMFASNEFVHYRNWKNNVGISTGAPSEVFSGKEGQGRGGEVLGGEDWGGEVLGGGRS